MAVNHRTKFGSRSEGFGLMEDWVCLDACE